MISYFISLAMVTQVAAGPLPLFRRYPSLSKSIPRFEILKEATPYEPMGALEKRLYAEQGKAAPAMPALWVKRDDVSASPLGGNKARKLEFLLGDVFEKHTQGSRPLSVVTSGMWGSNHALATAVAAQAYGLRAKVILGPQPVTENVQKKLLALHALGAEMHFYSNRLSMGWAMLRAFLGSKLMPSSHPVYIPPGGSNEYGDVGYVNAFLELLDQTGVEGLPAQIVVPVGTMGTSAGLLVGSCLGGVWERVKISGVNVADPLFTNDSATRREARKLYNFLRTSASLEDRQRMPRCNFKSRKAFEFVTAYYAPGYGSAKPEVYRGMALVKDAEGFTLDSTYSAKAMLYYLDEARRAIAQGRVLPHTLFWLTYNAYDLDQTIAAYKWTDENRKWLDLPKSFWRLYQPEGRRGD